MITKGRKLKEKVEKQNLFELIKTKKYLISCSVIFLVIGLLIGYCLWAYPSQNPDIKFAYIDWNYYGKSTRNIEIELEGKDFNSFVVGDTLITCFIIEDLEKKNFKNFKFDRMYLIITGRGKECGQILYNQEFSQNTFNIIWKKGNKIKVCSKTGPQFDKAGSIDLYYNVCFKTENLSLIGWFEKMKEPNKVYSMWNNESNSWCDYSYDMSTIWVETREEYIKRTEGILKKFINLVLDLF